MTWLAARVRQVVIAAGVPVVDVSLPDTRQPATWRVFPASLQGAAQPHLDAFDPNDPAHLAAELDREIRDRMDEERLISAVVWTVLDTYSAPATRAKYLAARTKIIDAYRNQPWKA